MPMILFGRGLDQVHSDDVSKHNYFVFTLEINYLMLRRSRKAMFQFQYSIFQCCETMFHFQLF